MWVISHTVSTSRKHDPLQSAVDAMSGRGAAIDQQPRTACAPPDPRLSSQEEKMRWYDGSRGTICVCYEEE